MRYWAGARRAAGVESEQVCAATVAELLGLLGSRPELTRIVPACSVLVDTVAADASTVLRDGALVDLLPPFAGG